MKDAIAKVLQHVAQQLIADEIVPQDHQFNHNIERTKDSAHGDMATNMAMTLAKVARKSPRDIAQLIIDRLPQDSVIEKVEIAGPGFINFFIEKSSTNAIVANILAEDEAFGRSQANTGKKVHIEYVSANPTGPLHVGHGRGACYGASLADLLEATGCTVHREYYVNDAGRQMHILGTSVWLRYLQRHNIQFEFPSNGYKGDYISDIAAELDGTVGESLVKDIDLVFDQVSADEPQGGDKEKHIDDLIANAKKLLGAEYKVVFDAALDGILNDIKDDLAAFGINYQEWFSEQSLMDSGAIQESIQRLTEKGFMYEKDGAIWFKSTEFGDDKDRVVVRENGQTTYFASDIAYHMNKLDRGFNEVVDVLGADHHGYIARVKAAMAALGANPDQLDVPLIQFANLFRSGEKVQMSTRSGSFVTLRELREEIGADATRFFYVMRKADQHLDFDLDLAKSQSNENPMYYIQYAHARVHRVFEQLNEKSLTWDSEKGNQQISLLNQDHEQALIKHLSKYPELVIHAAQQHEPHQIAHYLRELANQFHSYYNAHKFIIDDEALRNARLNLIKAVAITIRNGLKIIGVSAPQAM
jgi:arginyl-tRNA synthetase